MSRSSYPLILSLLAFIVTLARGCADHSNWQMRPRIRGRETAPSAGGNSSTRAETQRNWSYMQANEWASISAEYASCSSGTTQAPIALPPNYPLASTHKPDFSQIPVRSRGNFFNWGFGPAFTVARTDNRVDSLPKMTYDDQTVYLTGWHIHTPGDHVVADVRARAEVHYVFLNAEGAPKAVAAMRIDPGPDDSKFLESIPSPLIKANETTRQVEGEMDLSLIIKAVNFAEYWTYEGSLTTPPCGEGVRFFLARNVHFGKDAEVSRLLDASAYSARPAQVWWRQNVNM